MTKMIAIAALLASMGPQDESAVWVADPLAKIFPDAVPGPARTIRIQTARNEYESAQIVARGELKDVTVEFSDLKSEDGHAISPASWRYDLVGTVAVKNNIGSTRPEDLVRSAPGDFPDPFLEARTLDVPAGKSQPIWLTLHTPRDAAPGKYAGTVKAAGREIAVEVEVWPITIPDERHLMFTNWFFVGHFAKEYGVVAYSDEFYQKLEPCLEAIRAHRQNILWTDHGTIRISRDESGALAFDYAVFDRWIETLARHGLADAIEITQLGASTKGQFGEAMDFSALAVVDRKTGKTEHSKDRAVLAAWLESLHKHLQERGWLEKSLLHVADEPFPNHRRAYSELCAFVRQHAPKLRLIDAVISPNLDGAIDVYVPQLALFDHWRGDFEKIRGHGGELWFYTCCVPTGQFANRFIQNSLVQVRMLHWINRRFHMRGYLHWGLNYWVKNDWPAGDPQIIYPGKDGVLGSIRWEAVRDGLEDYEYFWLLDQAMGELKARLGKGAETLDPQWLGDALSGQAVRSGSDYVREPEALRSLRRKVAEAIVDSKSEIPVMIETNPPPSQPVNIGFPLISIKGATTPGAKILVNSKKFTTDADGRFDASTYIAPNSPKVVVKIIQGDKTVVRTFTFSMEPKKEY